MSEMVEFIGLTPEQSEQYYEQIAQISHGILDWDASPWVLREFRMHMVDLTNITIEEAIDSEAGPPLSPVEVVEFMIAELDKMVRFITRARSVMPSWMIWLISTGRYNEPLTLALPARIN